MARADLIVNLVRAGTQGDQRLFRSTVEAIAAEERGKRHVQLADKLQELLKAPTHQPLDGVRGVDPGHGGFLHEVSPRRDLQSLFLTPEVNVAVRELLEEQQRADLLRSYGIEPRHRVLLSGPPGNGKTTLAEALATELMSPLYVVRYEAVIGSFLGETSSRLKRIFDFVRTRQCVLFFDEFDTLGKERGDTHETGEIKRVVSALLLQIDALPSHVIVVTATNHSELLDRAAWRRFQLRLTLSPPTHTQRLKWFDSFQIALGQPLGISTRTLATRVPATSFSDLESFCQDIQRRYILSLPSGNLKNIVESRITQWNKRTSTSAVREKNKSQRK
ncbi:AAA family ATPase [Achromobacter xylosoxidans]|uniref:AAA family ATPase n=1 Tax=Alcaligenes xylosoxydans xylosoxydans TaxID=85698 RepID=UPI0009BB399C|nr:ATP-binding protein [Achromobacter xylosoxidans]